MKLRVVTVVGMLFAGGVSPALPAPVPADPPPIRIDAIVTDARNRPIKDLKISDFEISDAGETRALETAALHSASGGRLVAIFLDEYHVQGGANTERSRAALLHFIDTDLGPDDAVAVMKPLDTPGSIKVYTVGQDRGALQEQIASFSGRKGNYEPTTTFEKDFVSRASGPADASRALIVSSGLQALAARVGAMREGRKSLVLVSEGFSPSMPRGSDRLTGSLRAIVYAANRYGMAIYAIDPSGPAGADATDPQHTTLQALADQTGGEEAINAADLASVLKQAATDLDDYYELTYQAGSGHDGQFHPVELRVKRASARVRAKSGYWSPRPNLVPSGTATPAAFARSLRPTHSSPLIRPWIGTSRGPEGTTTVTVTWDPGLAPPRNQRVGSVELKATSATGETLFDSPFTSRASFTAMPGVVELEMTIFGLDGKRLDSDYRGLQVPNLQTAKLTIASLQVMRTRSAREFLEASANPSAAPAPSREFSKAERLLLRIPVYAPGTDVPSVTATLLNRLGTPMRSLSLVSPPLAADIVQFDLLLSSLAPDEYRVEIAAAAGADTAKALLLFRVTN